MYLATIPAPLGILCFSVSWVVELQAWSLVSKFVRKVTVSMLRIKTPASIAKSDLVNMS